MSGQARAWPDGFITKLQSNSIFEREIKMDDFWGVLAAVGVFCVVIWAVVTFVPMAVTALQNLAAAW